LLTSVVSGSDGSFQFSTNPVKGTVILAEISDGNYTDEVTGQASSLNVPLRAVAVWDGTAIPLTISISSEIAVRTLINAIPQDWSAARVTTANTQVAQNIGVTNLLDFKPIDLRVTSATSTLRPDDISQSLLSGGFAGFTPRANAIAGTTGVAGGLDAYYRLLVTDPNDDRFVPAYLLGLTDFISASALPVAQKDTLRSSLLLGKPSDIATTNAYYPNGTASGGATAAMPNDVLQLLPGTGGPFSPAAALFNARGALIAYQLAPSTLTHK
jgi:hypothetical protein